MTDEEFRNVRRQKFLDLTSFQNTLLQFAKDERKVQAALDEPDVTLRTRRSAALTRADALWQTFQLNYTAGISLDILSESLTSVVSAYEIYADACQAMPDDEYLPPFMLTELIDIYIDYLNILSAAVLLHREDLIPRIFLFIHETDFDGADAVLEEIFKRYVPERPQLDEWLYPQYRQLLNAIDSDNAPEMQAEMAKYVKKWYPSMKGKAHFWGKHETITPEFSPYFGYWAMCAAAFTYLYQIDDAKYRNEIVYPKDMLDYARSHPPLKSMEQGPMQTLRLQSGSICNRAGFWFTPAIVNSRQRFELGQVMPNDPDSPFGLIFWQWLSE